MKQPMDRDVMAMRVAREFQDGDVVNLGIGIPTLASNYIPEGRRVTFHSESGVLGYGGVLDDGEGDIDLINAGGQFVAPLPGMSVFSSADAFAMIRGRHIAVAVLGAFQVSERGDLANWMLPGRGIGNVGGAMDLAAGARRIIVVMEHVTKDGQPRLVRRCTYPLTGLRCVDLVVTDLAVIAVTPQGMELRETAPGYSAADIQAMTEARLTVAKDVREVEL
ncbi:MAG: 3-oxoacid CoA-transferase subunit B [Dehalococcoidia bacterium]|nr:3-oxoacid CoA-transferase subunit B [Dehalococcoidia bacterium]